MIFWFKFVLSYATYRESYPVRGSIDDSLDTINYVIYDPDSGVEASHRL